MAMARIEYLLIANPQDKHFTIVDIALSAKTIAHGSNHSMQLALDNYRDMARAKGRVTNDLGFGNCSGGAGWYSFFRAVNSINQEIEVRAYWD